MTFLSLTLLHEHDKPLLHTQALCRIRMSTTTVQTPVTGSLTSPEALSRSQSCSARLLHGGYWDLSGSRDRIKVLYLVGVVVRVANHNVHPVWFRRAKGTNGCRRLGVFTSAVTNKQLKRTINIHCVGMMETLSWRWHPQLSPV